MIDFTQGNIKDIEINDEKAMLLFLRRGINNLTFQWKRVPSYPAMGIFVQYPVMSRYRTTSREADTENSVTPVGGFMDKYGLILPSFDFSSIGDKWVDDLPGVFYTCPLGTYACNSLVYQLNTDKFVYDSETEYYGLFSAGYVLLACSVESWSDYFNKFPHCVKRINNLGTGHIWTTPLPDEIKNWYVSDAEWNLSDEETGQILLYATKEYVEADFDFNSVIVPPEDAIRTNYTFFGDKTSEYSGYPDEDPTRYVRGGSMGYWPTRYYELQPHDTDVVVEAGAPLITLSAKTGAKTTVTGIRNIDEYKAKYETATAGQFPKSTYPYLHAVVKIDCKSEALGIPRTYGFYVVFSVYR